MRLRLPSGREGMTFVELVTAMLIASLVAIAAMTFFRGQADALTRGTAKMTVVQNYRFALSTLTRDIRTTGAGALPSQPALVYAGEEVIAFNADYVGDDATDDFAVYIDPSATAGETQALRRADRFTLPRTSFAYPDTSFYEQGTNSGAETIIFYFAPDATTPRADDFVLMRQVNRAAPAVVSRNLLRPPGGKPFFEYLYVAEQAQGPSQVQAVPRGQLPLAHRVKAHGLPADTGAAAAVDRIRGVRITLTATNGETGGKEQRRTATRTVNLANAGVAVLQTCGEPPVSGIALGAWGAVLPDGRRGVVLQWSQAADERAGEQDVLRYVLWRKRPWVADWGDPYVSISSGQPSYMYVDEAVQTGDVFDYAIAAQDCSPSLSSLSAASGVAVP